MPDIEEHIRRAIEEGKFDELSGKGKPLNLDENPLVDAEWRLAYHMLRSSGYTLPWIELRQEIEAEIAAARASLQRSWDGRQTALAQGVPAGMIEDDWKKAMDAFRGQGEMINKQIANYNLQAPSEKLQMLKLSVEGEIQAVTTKGHDDHNP
jgi:DnaJ family protein C protein 28